MNDKGRLFVASPPEKISNYMGHIKEEFESVMPYLNKMPRNIEEEENITLHHGAFSLREAVKDILSIGKPIKVYGIPEEAVFKLGQGFLADFHRQRTHKKIPMFHIYNQNVNERI